MSTKDEQEKPERYVNMQTSRVIGSRTNLDGGEETEITAQVTLPHDISWGWVVVFGSFLHIFLVDGIAFTFGSLLPDISRDLQKPVALTALINSVAVALYFLVSPLASAFINRYGFRECAMTGSIVCSSALLLTYFSKKYWSVLLFYGILNGIGYSLLNMASGLIVGFYFEKWRPIALAIAMCGSSCGVMIMFPANAFFVGLAGWRTATLFHSGLFGLLFFTAMVFRPLASFIITKADESPAKVVTYLPSAMSISPAKSTQSSQPSATATERMFKAVSNIHFPTAAEVVADDTRAADSQPGPSALALIPSKPPETTTQQQLKKVQSATSKMSNQSATSTQNKTNSQTPTERAISIDKPATARELTQTLQSSRKKSCWARLCCLCHWEPHQSDVRPMYRDDAFYQGRLESLTAYQKSKLNTTAEGEIGLEYHIAVTRATAVSDIQERRGVFTTAMRRVLASMMDPNLLRRKSFILFCFSGVLIYLGFLVPYVYVKDRNSFRGIAAKHCSMFISVLGLSNAFGRLAIGALASRLNPVKLLSASVSLAGISTIVSGLSYNLYYQYAYCSVYGFAISSVASLRSVVLVFLYGLDNLTNATGMLFIFLGLGNLISTPMAGALQTHFGYDVAFIVAGTFLTAGGLILLPVTRMARKEEATRSSSK